MNQPVEVELAGCPLFSGLEAEEFSRVARASRTVHVRAGELLFREGQPCEGFYVVCSGKVRIYKLAPDGRERTLHVARPPFAFAEAAALRRGVFPAFAAAMEDSRLILVKAEPFIKVLLAHPVSAIRVIESLCGWLHQLVDQLGNETFLNARAKLSNYLLRQARRQSNDGAAQEVKLTEPKKDIASHLGMAPETFSRALADLEARRLIRATGRNVDLLDVDALESLLLGGDPPEAPPNGTCGR